jgi:hypothetical protein
MLRCVEWRHDDHPGEDRDDREKRLHAS